MPNRLLIKNAQIVNEGKEFTGSILIENEKIKEIFFSGNQLPNDEGIIVVDGTGKFLIPGVIDDQVHFREPGLTHKGDIYSESKAAAAGGITSYMEMPNTIPNTFTNKLLEEKFEKASINSLVNYSFYMGASNDNIDEILSTDASSVCGIKIFMGSSTGNLLVDNPNTLHALFSKCKILIAVHCEDEATIKHNLELAKTKYGNQIPPSMHPVIRDHKACYKSSSFAVELARKFDTRLHVLHISTLGELQLFTNKIPLKDKRITSEACIHHLWFSDKDYIEKGNFIKWNPAVKTLEDKEAIFNGVLNDFIDVIATDHAPHTIEEKSGKYLDAPSGGPLVQHALVAMMDFYHGKKISIEKIVEKMCHAPAICFNIKERGFIRKGYFADLVLIDPEKKSKVTKESLLYKCGWSPFEGHEFKSSISHTFVNGHMVYCNGVFNETKKGRRLGFGERSYEL